MEYIQLYYSINILILLLVIVFVLLKFVFLRHIPRPLTHISIAISLTQCIHNGTGSAMHEYKTLLGGGGTECVVFNRYYIGFSALSRSNHV